ncbi:DUF6584 family protein [Glaciecola siphonariae]|uniref:DUF6584 family protein n=1 Tax=Glaciecola siphonariae TaxID=521012 RepID=A0ABV9M054_9ALTE
MSVVNKMLQDLETRKTRAGQGADYIPQEKQGLKPWMLLASVCVISTAILLSQYDWKTPSNGDATEARVSASSPSAPDSSLPLASTPASAPASSAPASSVAGASMASHAQELPPADAVDAVKAETTRTEQSKTSLANTSQSSTSTPNIIASNTIAPSNKSPQNAASENSKANSLAKQDEASAKSSFSVAPSNGSQGRISSLREQARIALNNNDAPSAIQSLTNLIESYPEDVRARKQLASLLFSSARYEQARQLLQAGLRVTPADNAMRIMLARVAFKTGDFEDAHAALAGHPYPALANIELISFRAALAERLSQYEFAYQDYKLLVSREPNNAKWWLGLGVSQDKLNRGEQALASYQRVKGLNQLPAQVGEFVEQRIAILARQS